MEANSADLRLAWDTVPKVNQLEAAITAIRIATSEGADGQMAELAEKYFKKLEEDEAKSNIEKRTQSQVLWVAQLLANGAKDAHRYTNKPNQKNADIHYDGIQLPDDIAARVREIWALEWEVDNEERKAQAREAMEDLTEELAGMPTAYLRNMVTRSSLLKAAKSFKNGTAIGADQISFQEIANLPKEGLDEMVRLIRDIIQQGEWPDQAMTNVVALLGKKCGGAFAQPFTASP